MLQDEEVPFIMTLQAAKTEHPSFVVVDPFSVLPKYTPEMSEADKQFFSDKSEEHLKFLVMAVLCADIQNSVVNLKSPIVIDPENNCAKQVILENEEYPIRYRLFQDVR